MDADVTPRHEESGGPGIVPVQPSDMPLPQNSSSFLLAAILVLLILFTLYFTGEIVLPMIFAVILKLLLQPAMRLLDRLQVPRSLAALLLIILLFGGVGVFGSLIAGPAATWLAQAPDSLSQLEKQLAVFKRPLDAMQQASKQVEKLAEEQPSNVQTVTVKGPALTTFLFSGTRAVLAGVVTTVILLFFLLVAGDLFLRRLVEILPTLSDKRRAVEISHEIERNISGYLVTISLMNAAVGVATGIATYLTGLSDPVLWGTLAFLFNYILIIGPLTGVVVLFFAGMMTFNSPLHALVPAGIYLGIHVIEGQMVTPMLLARRFTLNPVLVVLSLVFWYWMWGVAGALLSVPLLATTKIICDRIRRLAALGHFIGGESPDRPD